MKILAGITADTSGELVFQLKALEAFATINKTKIDVSIPKDNYNMVKKLWFVSNLSTTTEGYDKVFNLRKDREAAHAKEFKDREDLKNKIDAEIERISVEKQINKDEINKPKFYDELSPEFPQTWNDVHAYAIAIEQDTELKAIPANRLPMPTILGGSHENDLANKYLHSIRDKLKPSKPFLLYHEPEKVERGIPVNFVPSYYSILKIDENSDMELMTGLTMNKRCLGVVGIVSAYHYIALSKDKIAVECATSDYLKDTQLWRYVDDIDLVQLDMGSYTFRTELPVTISRLLDE